MRGKVRRIILVVVVMKMMRRGIVGVRTRMVSERVVRV